MLKKLYDKSQLAFAIVWIVIYCVLLSVGDGLSAEIGVEKSVTFPVAFALSALLLGFLLRYGLKDAYGLGSPQISHKRMLYYLPLLLMLTANFWQGVALNYGALETLLYILSMLCVGFLEEVIFRGLLFEAIKKDSLKWAIIVSAVTFGMGHIINLINGSGADLLSNALQVVYATSAGVMFTLMYLRSGSLRIPILAHGLFNATSAFSRPYATPTAEIVSALALTIITSAYALYLAFCVKPLPKTQSNSPKI